MVRRSRRSGPLMAIAAAAMPHRQKMVSQLVLSPPSNALPAQVAKPRILDDGQTIWEAHSHLAQRYALPAEPPPVAASTPPPQQQPNDEDSESDEQPVRPAREEC